MFVFLSLFSGMWPAGLNVVKSSQRGPTCPSCLTSTSQSSWTTSGLAGSSRSHQCRKWAWSRRCATCWKLSSPLSTHPQTLPKMCMNCTLSLQLYGPLEDLSSRIRCVHTHNVNSPFHYLHARICEYESYAILQKEALQYFMQYLLCILSGVCVCEARVLTCNFSWRLGLLLKYLRMWLKGLNHYCYKYWQFQYLADCFYSQARNNSSAILCTQILTHIMHIKVTHKTA